MDSGGVESSFSWLRQGVEAALMEILKVASVQYICLGPTMDYQIPVIL